VPGDGSATRPTSSISGYAQQPGTGDRCDYFPCPNLGVRALGGDACEPCPSGKYYDTTIYRNESDPVTWDAPPRCVPCPAGHFANPSQPAANACHRCPEDTYQDQPGQGECIPCEEDEYSPPDRTRCLPRLPAQCLDAPTFYDPTITTTCGCDSGGGCRVTCTLDDPRLSPDVVDEYHAIIEIISDCSASALSDSTTYEGSVADLANAASIEGFALDAAYSVESVNASTTLKVEFEPAAAVAAACSAAAEYRVSLVSGGLGDVKCNVRRCDYFCGGSLGSSSSVLKKPDYASTTKGQGATRCSTQSKSVTCGAC